ncbi:MAG TPA: SIR2 family protein, partial [Candidatus Babeliaceae bacterium]|nr:SIR2 family protein [Candidatus Babeliaceae bacterium]
MPLQLPHSLIQDIRDHKVSLFLGAGASKEANFPTANELADYIVGKTGKDYIDKLQGQTLDFVADYLYTKPGYGKAWVREQIITYFINAHKHLPDPVSKAHEQITKIGWRRLFTTNYDRLIEISYDHNNERVQELFPVYDVSNGINRREDAIVQLIKLNGSYDRAFLDEKHELVLTFGEQRDAFTRNQTFYEILRQEATYGPIVFIGFRFAHPGARGASSPEFETLKNLLRDIGVGRWHYCVTPYDADDISSELAVSQLSAINVTTINATFGEFMASLAEVLDSRIAVHARPSIVVPVGKRELVIEADLFDMDRRHFQILGTYLNEIPAPEVSDSLNGKETWGTFVHENLIHRHCSAEFNEFLQQAFKDAPQFIVVDAPPGWGKTFFLKDISISFYKSGRPVIWLNPYATIEKINTQPIILGSWDVIRIQTILAEIKTVFDQQGLAAANTVPIIIADNCPERVDELISMYNALRDSGEKFVLIFSMRDTELQHIRENQPLIRRRVPIFHAALNEDIQTQRNEIDQLIEFCRQHHVGAIRDQGEADLIVRRIFEEDAQVLLILSLFIIFDRAHRPFSEIVKDFWDNLSSEIAKMLVLRTSALHRFGSRFSPRLYTLTKTFPRHENSDVLDIYQREVERGRGFLYEYEEEGEPCVRTLHSLVAQRITQPDICEKSPAEVDQELLTVISNMSANGRDLEMLRALLKNITEYKINLATEEKIEELFATVSKVTSGDWVVCHQFANYLLSQGKFERALSWIDRAIDNNPDHTTLIHTKGNIYFKWGRYLREQNNAKEAEVLFKEAGTYFSMSRIRREPDEYGYVTDL